MRLFIIQSSAASCQLNAVYWKEHKHIADQLRRSECVDGAEG